jgi:hypothetical protein
VTARTQHQPGIGSVISTDLSSATPLASGASFTSPWILALPYNAIRIACFTDQSGDLRTQHSDDAGVTILRDSHQAVTANRSEFLSFHPRATYFRIVFDNTSASAQTVFHLTTVLADTGLTDTQSQLSASLSRSSLATQTRAQIYDFFNDEFAAVAPQIQDLQTVQRTSIIADNFRQTTGLDTQTWASTLTGTGGAAIVNGRLDLTTGVTANSTSRVNTRRVGRFVSGSHQLFRVGVKFTDVANTNNRQRLGAYDDTSGYFWELDSGTLYAVSRRAGTDTRVAAADFNIIDDFVVAATSYRLEILYFGNTAIFSVNGEPHHRMSGEVSGLPRTNGTNFPNRFECINYGGSTTARTLTVTGTSQQRYGPDHTSPRYVRVLGAGTTVLKSDSGRLHRVIVSAGIGGNTTTIYDDPAAAVNVIAALGVGPIIGSVEIGVDFNNGLAVIQTGAATDVTYIFD